MATEIERKFLVTSSQWKDAEAVYYCQGYLNREPKRTVRIRIAGDAGFLTIKGETTGMSRDEFEYSIPVADAQAMLKLCEQPLIEKNRRIIEHGEMSWEVDEFLGDNEGLSLPKSSSNLNRRNSICPIGWVKK
jgi:adenylate cyclase